MGVLYVLDEPSIGLHQRDNARLIGTLKHLRDLGNTVMVVEHDEDTIRTADYLLDIGPGAGIHGGHVVAPARRTKSPRTVKEPDRPVPVRNKDYRVPKKRRPGNGKEIVIRGARENNLQNVDVHSARQDGRRQRRVRFRQIQPHQ
jgi:excinuclease ABC subunit A